MAEANSDVDPIPYDAETPELEDVDDEREDVEDERDETNFMAEVEVPYWMLYI